MPRNPTDMVAFTFIFIMDFQQCSHRSHRLPDKAAVSAKNKGLTMPDLYSKPYVEENNRITNVVASIRKICSDKPSNSLI